MRESRKFVRAISNSFSAVMTDSSLRAFSAWASVAATGGRTPARTLASAPFSRASANSTPFLCTFRLSLAKITPQ